MSKPFFLKSLLFLGLIMFVGCTEENSNPKTKKTQINKADNKKNRTSDLAKIIELFVADPIKIFHKAKLNDNQKAKIEKLITKHNVKGILERDKNLKTKALAPFYKDVKPILNKKQIAKLNFLKE